MQCSAIRARAHIEAFDQFYQLPCLKVDHKEREHFHRDTFTLRCGFLSVRKKKSLQSSLLAPHI